MSKIQDLKGTHNPSGMSYITLLVVSDVKDTRFERNSQRSWYNFRKSDCCFWCQRYKIWKELTTYWMWNRNLRWLFLMSKIQDLKGTHNGFSIYRVFVKLFLMSKIQDLKGTHNWRHYWGARDKVVSDVKDTRFERNSQHSWFDGSRKNRCFWCQRYKIWKELTTIIACVTCYICCFWCQRYKIWKELTTEYVT